MTRPAGDRGGVSLPVVVALLAALGGGGAAIAATTALISSMAPQSPQVSTGGVRQGPTGEILNYGAK